MVVNPNSGPGGIDLPDVQYQIAIPYFQRYDNVTLLGYVRTDYGKRDLNVVKAEVDTYSKWRETSVKGGLGLDGIFIDEVPWDERILDYYTDFCGHIRSVPWRLEGQGILR